LKCRRSGKEVAAMMRAALADLVIDEKLEVLARLQAWLALEERSWLPEAEQRQ
jgi:hypothetical protein